MVGVLDCGWCLQWRPAARKPQVQKRGLSEDMQSQSRVLKKEFRGIGFRGVGFRVVRTPQTWAASFKKPQIRNTSILAAIASSGWFRHCSRYPTHGSLCLKNPLGTPMQALPNLYVGMYSSSMTSPKPFLILKAPRLP